MKITKIVLNCLPIRAKLARLIEVSIEDDMSQEAVSAQIGHAQWPACCRLLIDEDASQARTAQHKHRAERQNKERVSKLESRARASKHTDM